MAGETEVLFESLQPTESDVEENRSLRERFEDAAEDFQEGSGGPSAEDVADAKAIAPKARQLIVDFEVSGKADYDRRYKYPIWPGGDSGITIGIGYDVGYCTAEEFSTAWGGRLAAQHFEDLKTALGRKAQSARGLVPGLKHIEVPWNDANSVFDDVTLPIYAARTKRVFAGCRDLHPLCYGALISLVYNRGASTKGPKRVEMLEIQRAIAEGKPEKVPRLFRSMKRLWPDMRGLVRRREAEAQLFEEGLIAKQNEWRAVVAAAPAVTQGGPAAAQATPSLQESSEAFYERAPSHDGDGADFDIDYNSELPDPPLQGPLEATPEWIGVQWVKDDNLSADYRHVLEADRAAVKETSFLFTAEDLELLLRNNCIDLDKDPRETCMIFGLRGTMLNADPAAPADRYGQIERQALRLKATRPNHENFRCVIGVYNRATRRLSGFMASTVPNRGAVNKCKETGRLGNLLAAGHYRYHVGAHSKGRFKGCLRQAQPIAVQRSRKNLVYDVADVWDITLAPEGWPMDNIHPAFVDKTYGSAEFSSFGCQVVRGTFRNGAYTEQFGDFRKALGLRAPGTDDGRVFSYVLLTGDEAAVATMLRMQQKATDFAAVSASLARLRQGSSGPMVTALQTKLGVKVTGYFDGATKTALIDVQRRKLGELAGDGVYAPAIDAALGFGVFVPPPSDAAMTVAANLQEGMGSPGAARTEDNILFDIGRRSLIAETSPDLVSANVLPQYESVTQQSWQDLVARGQRVLTRAEKTLFEVMFGKNLEHDLDRAKIRLAMLQTVGAEAVDAENILSRVISSTLVMPNAVSHPIAELLYARFVSVLKNEARNAPSSVLEELRVRWSDRLNLAASESKKVEDEKPKSRFVGPEQGGKGCKDVFAAVTSVLDAAQIDYEKLHTNCETAYEFLADASARIAEDDLVALMNKLKSKRQFRYLARTGDRAMTLFPDNLTMKRLYAQSLIELGQRHAAINLLEAEINKLEPQPPAHARKEYTEMCGLVGRAYKQLYVDNVRAADAPKESKAAYKANLRKALDAYAKIYRSAAPGTEYWHGVNVAALLALAEQDGHSDIVALFERPYTKVAQEIIDVQTQRGDKVADRTWSLASIAEAYLLLGDMEKATHYVSEYLTTKDANQFEIASTARQFEEVLRITSAGDKRAAVLALLKAKQIATKEGRFTLDGDTLKQQEKIAKSDTYKELYNSARELQETMTPNGSFLEIGLLAQVVNCAQAIAAVTDVNGKTWGTGFLVRGNVLNDAWGDGIYVVTNSHVLSCPAWEKEYTRSPLNPQTARIVLQAAGGDALELEPHAAFLSQPGRYDVAVVKVKNPPAALKTLSFFPHDKELTVEDPEKLATTTPSTVSIIGCPLGGPLSLSVVGQIEGANGVLVDIGGRDATDDDPVYLHYRAPTQKGNSGSPVFDTQTWTVVALHHEGFSEFNGRACLCGRKGVNYANEGVSIHSIRRAIAKAQAAGPAA